MDDDGRVVLPALRRIARQGFVDPVGGKLIIDHFAEKCTGFGALPPDVEALGERRGAQVGGQGDGRVRQTTCPARR